MALYFILRAKKSYFLDSGFFMGLANVGFILFLVETTISDAAGTQASPTVTTGLISLMAISIGLASYLLGRSDKRTHGGMRNVAKFLSRPPLLFLLYITVVLIWTISTLASQLWSPGGGAPFLYPAWYIPMSSILLASFILLPVLSFYRQSSAVADRKASISMKIISVSWGLFGVITFVQTVIVGAYQALSQGIALADSFLFVVISFALREPTILTRIITAGETVTEAVYSHPEDDTIVLYNTESDRKRLVETFVKDGLATGQDVACYVTKSDAPFYRALLKGSDLPGSSYSEHQVSIQILENLSTQPANSSIVHRRISKARRELVDLDELELESCREIITRISALDEVPAFRRRMWALNVEGANAGILSGLMEKNPRSRVIDLARQQDIFSNLLDLGHRDTLGGRILMEYEPIFNYEEVVQKFVREFQANAEGIAVFTSMGSPIYRMFRDQRNIRLFSFSTKTSTPVRLSDEQVLLPERDASLLLDAVDKLLQTHHGRPIGIVFDVFTDLILFQGFEKAYGVLSSVVEMSESELATIMVLVNNTALEERVLNGIRGLFRTYLRIDAEGVRTIRVSSLDIDKGAGMRDPETGERRSARGGVMV